MTRPVRQLPERRSRPPMGWDCYGTTVTEDEVLAHAVHLRDRTLAHGWDTVVADIQRYGPTARGRGYSRMPRRSLTVTATGCPRRTASPSAADGAGFTPPADRVHGLGLRCGPHIMRGVPGRAVAARLPVAGTAFSSDEIADTGSVCPWNCDNRGLNHGHPGAQPCYDAQVARFAEWGVDFVKADDMLFPYHEREIAAPGDRTQRPAHGAEPLPRHRGVARPPRAPAGERHHVAGVRRPVGPLGGPCGTVRAHDPLGALAER